MDLVRSEAGTAPGGALRELIKPFERSSCIFPGIAFVGHKRLQNRLRAALSMARAIFEETGERRDVLVVRAFRKKRGHFEIGIYALLNTPEEFENQPIVINDGAVALLAPQQFRFRRSTEGRARVRLDSASVILSNAGLLSCASSAATATSGST